MTIERSHDAKETSSGSAGNTMKISNSTIQSGIPANRSEAIEKKGPNGASSEKIRKQASDRVELSVNRENIERLSNALAAVETSSAERIQSLKTQIESGNYNVSGRAVAEKMLRSIGVLTTDGEE